MKSGSHHLRYVIITTQKQIKKIFLFFIMYNSIIEKMSNMLMVMQRGEDHWKKSPKLTLIFCCFGCLARGFWSVVWMNLTVFV